MKQYQIIIRNTNTKGNGNILYKGNLWSLTMKDLPDDAGYATLGAAKRIATLINKDPKRAGLVDMLDIEDNLTMAYAEQVYGAGLVDMVDMLDIEAQAMSVEEITRLVVDQGKSLTRDLVERYYPEQEKRIQDEAERAKAEAAVGGRLTDEEWAEVKAANAKAQSKPVKVKVKTPKAPKAPKEPKAKPEKDPFFITDLQRKFLDLMRQDNFYERGVDSTLFIPILADTLEPLGISKMITGAMVSTLREKGMLVTGLEEWSEMGSTRTRKMKCFKLTEIGKEVMRREGLAD